MSELTLRNRQCTRPLDLRVLRKIADSFLRERFPSRPYEISISIVAASEMAALNEKHLGHVGSTDVITFEYTNSKTSEPLIGDIFICLDDAVKQAREFKTSWQSELVRYFVHGVLHLEGCDDLRPAERRAMKREENRLLRQLENRFHLSRIHAVPRTGRSAAGHSDGANPIPRKSTKAQTKSIQ